MIRILLAFTTVAMLLSFPALAEIDNADIAVCAAMKGDLDRLECYDELARDNDLNAPQPMETNVEGVGAWSVDVRVNPIDDSRTVIMMLTADSGRTRWGEPVTLFARCRSNSTEVYISWNEYLGSESNVLTRIGDEPATSRQWSVSTNSQASFHPRPIAFLKEMMKADSMVAQTTPYNENPVTAIFDITGINNAITPLRETCNW